MKASGHAAAGDEQTLKFARDLAQLYRRVREDGLRLARFQARVQELARLSLSLVEATSAEAAGARLVRELVQGFGASRSALFVSRAGRFRILSLTGDPPVRSWLSREEVADLGNVPRSCGGAPWSDLGFGDPVHVVPLLGRGGATVGFAAIVAPGLTPDDLKALELFGPVAGPLLELHLVAEARLEVERRGAGSPTALKERPEAHAASALLGECLAMKRIRELLLQVGPVSAPVLVLGETGTGKELVARAIHEASPRSKGPFVAVNCGAIPENLVESEIFGHEAGAFTGAQKRHRGKVELADGGTLFLDELGEMPQHVQVKFLRFLQDSTYAPLGGEKQRKVDVRIVAATNKRIEAAVAARELREDLLFRLNVFTIALPPLRDRGDDIVMLGRAFARELAAKLGVATAPRLSPAAEKALQAYAWPGNVRELRNVMERAVVLAVEGVIGPDLLPQTTRAIEWSPAALPAEEPRGRAAPAPAGGLVPVGAARPDWFRTGDAIRPFAEAKADFLERFERAYCDALLEHSGGNIALAARIAVMDKKNLHRKIRAYQLEAHRSPKR
jgi:DNA-binding NtrC family response regulator